MPKNKTNSKGQVGGGGICDNTFYANIRGQVGGGSFVKILFMLFRLIQYVNFQQLLMNVNSEANFKVAFESWLKKAFRFIVATD